MNVKGQRSKWFPYSYSHKKSDIIYRSSQLNCQSEYGCGTLPDCEHEPKWKMFNFDEYFTKNTYDFLTIGCSVTYGTEIKKSSTWRSHLGNAVDISVPGIGIDAIWHNLKYLTSQDRVSFKKIIILLPNSKRKTFRVRKDDKYFNFISTEHDENNPNPNFAFRSGEMEKLLASHRRYLMLNGERYGERILDRFINWLNDQKNTNIYVSSWDDHVFESLSQKVKKKDLVLAKFPYNHIADSSIKHPSPGAHKKWLEQIHYIL